ncbi:MAG TPA: TIGR02588 family protein [Herpetosiphonaceae bacterium]
MSQATQSTATTKPQAQSRTAPHRSPAEMVTFGVAVAILLMIAGLVIYDWVATPSTPPAISLTQSDTIREIDGQFYVPFTIENTGGSTAESVQVSAELKIGDEVEEGEQQIDFLAAGETQEGAFVFSRDPAEGELTMRVASYKMP